MRPICLESGTLGRPAVIVHGGAGEFGRHGSATSQRRLGDGLTAALGAAWAVLSGGGASLMLSSRQSPASRARGDFNAGRGAVATSNGAVETDAAVMDGERGTFGAICAATWPDSPVRAARAVLRARRARGRPGPARRGGGGQLLRRGRSRAPRSLFAQR